MGVVGAERRRLGRKHPPTTSEDAVSVDSRPEDPLLSQRGAGLPNDDVIEHPDFDETQGVLQALSEEPIARAGLADPTGMVVPNEAGPGVDLEGPLDDLAGMDRRPVEGAAEQLLNGEDTVFVIKPDYPENLMLQGTQAQDRR